MTMAMGAARPMRPPLRTRWATDPPLASGDGNVRSQRAGPPLLTPPVLIRTLDVDVPLIAAFNA